METKNDLIKLQLQIVGRSYPIFVENHEEENMVKEVVQSINAKVNHFMQTHKGIDKQDALAMSVLTYAIDLFKDIKNPTENHNEIDTQLLHIQSLLDTALENS